MKSKNDITTLVYNSPYGDMLLGDFHGKLCLCDWLAAKHRAPMDQRLRRMLHAGYLDGTSPAIKTAISQLEEYFAGERKVFDLPFIETGTDFQLMVWNTLKNVPYGTTTTYMDIARSIGMPKAVRAVANAIGANPLAVIIPCHRIIGSNGSLTGFAGGIETKRALLEMERRGLVNSEELIVIS